MDNGGSVDYTSICKLKRMKRLYKSPLVLATSRERSDIISTLIKVGGFDVNEVEEDSGLNPLAAALKCGNKVLLV